MSSGGRGGAVEREKAGEGWVVNDEGSRGRGVGFSDDEHKGQNAALGLSTMSRAGWVILRERSKRVKLKSGEAWVVGQLRAGEAGLSGEREGDDGLGYLEREEGWGRGWGLSGEREGDDFEPKVNLGDSRRPRFLERGGWGRGRDGAWVYLERGLSNGWVV
nr:hypothetical protein Iba_chr13bCG15070 [Ipomoea batatas]